MHYADHEADVGNEVIKRPNHGLASAVRKAALVPVVVDAYRREYGKHASKSKLGSFNFDPTTMQAMAQAMVFSVVGRKSEVGYKDDPAAYTRYKEASVAAFKDFAEKQSTSQNVRNAVADALLNAFMGQPSSIKRVLEISHNLDLMRCAGTSGMLPRIQALEKDIGKDAARKLAKRAAAAIFATGDRLLFAPGGEGIRTSYAAPTFALCSRDAAKCWELAGSSPSPTEAPSGAPPVADELAFDGAKFSFEKGFDGTAAAPLRFAGSSFKTPHAAITQMWAAANWNDSANVVAQRELVLDCLDTLLRESPKGYPSLTSGYRKLVKNCEIDGESTADLVVKLWSHPGIVELGGRELCSILGDVIREDDARTPVVERPSKLFQSAVTLVCMLQVRLNSS